MLREAMSYRVSAGVLGHEKKTFIELYFINTDIPGAKAKMCLLLDSAFLFSRTKIVNLSSSLEIKNPMLEIVIDIWWKLNKQD